jgi:hypothetical protein
MVTPATSHLDPPKSWEELEEICADLFGREWKDNNTTRYGRQGQRQNGVDIYGRPDGKNYAGVQCKGRSKWPPDPLTTADIDEEVAKAKAFSPKLSEYTIATVDPNDVVVQDHARRLTEQHAKDGLFSVHVASWPELMRRLTQHPDLIKKHYGYVSNSQIQRDVQGIPDRVLQAIREQLPSLGANEQKRLLATPTIPSDPSTTQAMERDLKGRYEAALQRSLFPEYGKLDEFQDLADAASGQQYASVSASLRRRVLLRASRSASARGFVERGKSLLQLAQALSGEDSDLPARARIAEAESDVQEAIVILRDQIDADSRSTLLNILFRARGTEAALLWLAEERLDVPDLTMNGVHTLCLCHLQRLDIESLRVALEKLTPDQLKESPYFLFLRAAANLASVLPVPEHNLPLIGLPLEVMRAHVVLPDATAAARLDSALADLRSFMPFATTLGLREAGTLAGGYATWCELLHPYRKAAGLSRLRDEMKDPKTALERLQFAFAYDPEFKADDVANYLQRREQLGGLDDAELRAMLALRLHGNDPGAVAKLIAQYRPKIEAAFPATLIASIEIQALAKAGEVTSARQLLKRHQEEFDDEARAGLEAEVAKAEGADPVEEDLRHYESTGTVEALRSLLASVGRKGDHRAVARYSEQLYQRTNDPQDIARAAQAFAHLRDGKELIRVMSTHPFLVERDAALARTYGWQLFQSGRLKQAKEIAEGLQKRTPPARDLHLEIAIAIESGEWDSLATPLAAFLDDSSKYSALELIRAAHVAQASGKGPMIDLVKAAVAKDEPDPNVWLGAYTFTIEEGLEDQIAESHQWFQRALALSGADGPIQRFELKELLRQQQEWNERTRSISHSIVRGEVPLIFAATGLRTTVIDILLRNLIRNIATGDARKRVAVPLFSGSRPPAATGAFDCLALDISALLVLGWLGILPTVLKAFPKIMLPATILSELFEGRRRIQHVQKSRIKRAAELEQAIARGRLKVVRRDDVVRDDLSKEVGDSLGGFIRAAEAANGVVLRPAPVHKPGLEQINADVAAHMQALSDMQTLLTVLVDHGAVDQAKEEVAKRYFDLQDTKWPSSARPDPDRPLFIDGLALIYLQYTDLLGTVLDVFKDVRIEADAQDEALLIIDHNRHVTEVLANIDAIRTTIRDANAMGKVMFGPHHVEREEAVRGDSISPSTLHLLTNLSGADAIVCDDRFLNKEAFAQDTSGKRVHALTTLDIIEELKQSARISESERRSLRHRLRAGGAVLMPVDAGEIASAATRSGAMKSAEFRALEDSIDLAHLAEVPVFPREMPWFASFNMAAKAAILEVWKTEPDRERAAMISDIILELVPNPEDWISRWEGNPPPEWVQAVRIISIASLAMPVELVDDQSVAAYNDWLENRLLEPMRATEPELYWRVIAHLRRFIESASEDGDEQAT